MSLLLDALKKTSANKPDAEQAATAKPEAENQQNLAPDLPTETHATELDLSLEPLFSEDEFNNSAADYAASDITDPQHDTQALAHDLRSFLHDDTQRAIEPTVKIDPSTGDTTTIYAQVQPVVQQAVWQQRLFGVSVKGRIYRLTALILLGLFIGGAWTVYRSIAELNTQSVVSLNSERPATTAVVAQTTDSATSGNEKDLELLIEQEDYQQLEQSLNDATAAVSIPATKSAATSSSAKPSTRPSAQPTTKKAVRAADDFSVVRTSNTQALLMQAYQAYQRDELTLANTLYTQVLQSSPNNRDALLGIAAVFQAQGDAERAGAYYRRLLERNPRDATAQAGLLSLQPSLLEQSTAAISQIKQWLNHNNDSPHLYFSLGNVYAGQRRWAEAQQAYFDAYRLDNNNPDYAFNLAVSLDHLDKLQAAIQYYQRALVLAETRKAHFDFNHALQRIDELQ